MVFPRYTSIAASDGIPYVYTLVKCYSHFMLAAPGQDVCVCMIKLDQYYNYVNVKYICHVKGQHYMYLISWWGRGHIDFL